MSTHTNQSDANQKLIERLGAIKTKYEEQMRHTKSAKVLNSCLNKINTLQNEMNGLLKKEQKSSKQQKKQPLTSPAKLKNDKQIEASRMKEAAKKAEEKARKAKAYASINFELRHTRSHEANKKRLMRQIKEVAQQERRRTNQEAQTAKMAAKQATKSQHSPDFNHTRKSPRLFEEGANQPVVNHKNKRLKK
jgi:hypothetical protein